MRSLFVWINNNRLVEGTLDGGSQIVAINKRVAFEKKISYDPTKRLPMVSANGTTEETLGLARDVPIELDSGITIYLQMYVVRNANYDLLLGRPFEALLSSAIQNSTNGRQTIQVMCPNTGRQQVLPTYTRGERPGSNRSDHQVFQRSRI